MMRGLQLARRLQNAVSLADAPTLLEPLFSPPLEAGLACQRDASTSSVRATTAGTGCSSSSRRFPHRWVCQRSLVCLQLLLSRGQISLTRCAVVLQLLPGPRIPTLTNHHNAMHATLQLERRTLCAFAVVPGAYSVECSCEADHMHAPIQCPFFHLAPHACSTASR